MTFQKLVRQFLDAMGVQVAQPGKIKYPLLVDSTFDSNVAATEAAHRHRLGLNRRIETNTEMLR
jgi:hypothetical protein